MKLILSIGLITILGSLVSAANLGASEVPSQHGHAIVVGKHHHHHHHHHHAKP